MSRLNISFLALILIGPDLVAQEATRPATLWPGVQPAGQVLLPNGWSLRPAGKQYSLGSDFPVTIATHPTAPLLAVLFAGYGEHEVATIDPETGRVHGKVVIPQSYGGLAWSPDGKRLYVGGGFDQVIYRFDRDGDLLGGRAAIRYEGGLIARLLPPDGPRLDDRTERGTLPAEGAIAGLAVSADNQTLWVANPFAHTIARFDANTGERLAEVKLPEGSYPYALTLHPSRNVLYTSLWGAAKVAELDTANNTLLGQFATQEHPNEMVLSKDGNTLYVANANRNTVSVINTIDGKSRETINTAISPQAPSGSTPNSIALTPDEKVLFIANANTNDLAVIDVSKPGESRPLGFIPTGWYPTSVRVAKDGGSIYIANGKGGRSKANRSGPNPLTRDSDPTMEYIGGLFEGTLSVVPNPGPAQMVAFTQTVYDCSPVNRNDPVAADQPSQKSNPIPAKIGDPSPIKYCIYIIKENRTYDQVLGDIPEGNGDPSICLFPEKVTPNQHAIAKGFVLLDNFYVESEVSADGHEWTMGAYATDFVERTWPLSYRGDRRVPYPSEGALKVAEPSGGYLWDKAAEKGVSYYSFGEFIQNGETSDDPSTTTIEALKGHFDPQFRGYDLSYPDMKRAERVLAKVKEWEAEGEMPQLVIVRLPNDHTSGTRPGAPTPTAMVAENDLAMGKLLEGLSRTKFWPKMAVFSVEDDAQNGPDHVDAHRTIAFVAGPYVQRKHVDSNMYSTSSMLRTMELILGLDPMSQFDASARPMYDSFTAQPDLKPYDALPAGVPIDERNKRTAWGAKLSQELNLATEDAADDLLFNEIIWKSVRGAESPMPAPVRAAFIFPHDEREEGEEDEDDVD
jgi:YVTN family beta-propeller protein